MKRMLLLILILCLAGAGAVYFWTQQAGNFAGNYVGPMKVPGVGWTAARIKIVKDGKDFEVTGVAGHYKRMPTEEEYRAQLPRAPKSLRQKSSVRQGTPDIRQAPKGVPPEAPDATGTAPHRPPYFSKPFPAPGTYVWDESLGASYRGKLVGNDLVLDAQMGFVFSQGKLSGSLVMPDGTVFKQDTPANYQAVKDEVRAKLLQSVPGADVRE